MSRPTLSDISLHITARSGQVPLPSRHHYLHPRRPLKPLCRLKLLCCRKSVAGSAVAALGGTVATLGAIGGMAASVGGETGGG
jgi:hypothetical protein